MKKFIKRFIKFRNELNGQPYRSHFLKLSSENVIKLFEIYLNDVKGVENGQ